MKDLISHQLVKYLEGRGVTYIFGLCGHTNIAVLTALEKSSIKFVNTRHEQVAAHAADGYPRYPSEDCYFIAGTQGSLAVPTMRTWIYAQGEKAPGWHTPFVKKTLPLVATDTPQAQLDHFCDLIAGKAAPIITVADALQSLRTVEAVRRSMATG